MNRFSCRGVRWIRGVVISGMALAFCSVQAEIAAPPPIMLEAGSVLVDDAFTTALPKSWRAGKGHWECVDGAVRGTEVAADKHQAVMRRPLAFANAVITFSFRLDQARQISFSVNDAKEHVCRVVITARGFVVQKDDHDHDGPDKAVVFARVPMALATDVWHSVTIELNGREMVAQVDGGNHVGFGAHEMLDRPKANIGLTVAGGPAEFRDLRIRAATPRAEWAETKAKLAKRP